MDAIVTPESHWQPCAVYPSHSDCGYTGTNSCGIPQANPCPLAWRGRLAATWRPQVRYLIRYIAGRYGDPLHARTFHDLNGWY